MPKGTKHGSNQLEIAYVHGRIDAKVESAVETAVSREIELWSHRFSIDPMELKQELGVVPVSSSNDWLRNLRMASGGRRSASSSVESSEQARNNGAQNNRSGNSQDAPGQMMALPEPKAKRGNSKIKKYWAAMTPQQRAAEMAKRLSKREDLTSGQRKQLASLRTSAAGKLTPEKRAENRERQRKLRAAQKAGVKPVGRNGKAMLSKEERAAKQRIYQARNVAKRQGLPVPPLPGKERAVEVQSDVA